MLSSQKKSKSKHEILNVSSSFYLHSTNANVFYDLGKAFNSTVFYFNRIHASPTFFYSFVFYFGFPFVFIQLIQK